MTTANTFKNIDSYRTQNESDTEEFRRTDDYIGNDYNGDGSSDNLQGAKSLESRDMLLVRCRDAIETLHEEIQGERQAKHQLQQENQELCDLTS